MKILITTPGGRFGRRIVPELLAPEFSVRVITRNPSRLPAEIRQQVEVVRGSIDDVNALTEALHDVDALFWCVPRPSLQEMDVQSYHERFARAAALSVREAQTPRVVAISPRGVGFEHVAALKGILNQSGAAIRHLHCGWPVENLLQGSNSVSEPGLISRSPQSQSPVSMISIENVADVALRFLVRRDWYGVDVIEVGDRANLLQACSQTGSSPIQPSAADPLHLVAVNCS